MRSLSFRSICSLAWRESRTNRRRLLWFVSSIVFGVGALIAVDSVEVNLRQSLQQQAKKLLGADLVLRSRQPMGDSAEMLISTFGGAQAREVSFSSMALFTKTHANRLTQVRAVDPEFPFYGELETVPEQAAFNFQHEPAAVVEDSLMLQFNAEVGDFVKLGSLTFRIVGRLKKVPGETAAAGLIGARVYIPRRFLKETGLIQPGSAATYKVYFRFSHDVDVSGLLKKNEAELQRLRLDSETVEDRQQSLGRSLRNSYEYLALVAFIALLLGSIGIASAVHVYAQQKVQTIAILRCLGMKAQATFSIYLVQIGTVTFIGALGGVLLGLTVQYLLPGIMKDFLPVTIPFAISWSSLLKATSVGLGTALLFSLLPLLALRQVSPLVALRSSFETPRRGRDLLRWLLLIIILLAIVGFAIVQTRSWNRGVLFAVGLLLAWGILALTALLIRFAAKRLFPPSWSYVWRQGLSNLYRPHNQTLVLMFAIGLGTCLIMILFLTHRILVTEVSHWGSGRQPNMVLFDIQPDQTEAVRQLVGSFAIPILQEVPIVTMRLTSIRGRMVADILKDPANRIPEFALQREYRSTFRDHLIETETLLAGKWQPRVPAGTATILISLEEGIAKRLESHLGDELIFDVQGVPVKTQVGSLRRVQWERVQPNFFVLFPAGVLETAPHFDVMVLKTPSTKSSADLQGAVVQNFANISAIDLELIVSVVDEILAKISLIVRFVAGFSILTGLIVLAVSVLSSRYQRQRESVLLRTLGARSAQVLKILLVEYFLIGIFATISGLFLAWAGSWALARFVFEAPFTPAVWTSLLTISTITLMVMCIGVWNSRGITSASPLEVLRREG